MEARVRGVREWELQVRAHPALAGKWVAAAPGDGVLGPAVGLCPALPVDLQRSIQPPTFPFHLRRGKITES